MSELDYEITYIQEECERNDPFYHSENPHFVSTGVFKELDGDPNLYPKDLEDLKVWYSEYKICNGGVQIRTGEIIAIAGTQELAESYANDYIKRNG